MPSHAHTHTPYSVNTVSCCFYSRGEPEEKKLRSELKHDSCTLSLSLCWDYSEGESWRLEEALGERLTSEKMMQSFLCEWKLADGEFSEEGIDREREGGKRDEMKEQSGSIFLSLLFYCPIRLPLVSS